MPLLVFLLATVAIVTLLTPRAWPPLVLDGLLVAGVLASAAGFGIWPSCWLAAASRGVGQWLCAAIALGLGIIGTATLALGMAGVLHRGVSWAIVTAGILAGIVWLLRRGRLSDGTVLRSEAVHRSDAHTHGLRSPQGAPQSTPISRLADAVQVAASLIVAAPTAILLLGACLPPGVLWDFEARGYDALEYHLQAPREYFDAGRIQFLPHNVYASFPQQMEMLYLLLMHLKGNPHAAAIAAQLLHAACAALAVLALGAWTPAGWPRRFAWLVAATTPWLSVLGCLAYTECGMLFFAAVAAGLLTSQLRNSDLARSESALARAARGSAGELAPASATGPSLARLGFPARGGRWLADATGCALAAGLCAGFAGGCKYLAIAFVTAALGIAWLVAFRARGRVRVMHAFAYVVGAALALSPWLLRNLAFTGNPVYPFAYALFGGQEWSEAQALQWQRGHRVPQDSDSLGGRLARAARELLGGFDPKGGFHLSYFGPAIFVLAAVGTLRAPRYGATMLWIWAALILAGWIAFTHMPSRFAVPLVVPLTMLASSALRYDGNDAGERRRSRPYATRAPVLAGLALAGGVIGDLLLAGTLRRQAEQWHGLAALRALVDNTQFFLDANLVNALPSDAHVWIVGDAAVFYVQRRCRYTVVFSRDPWLELAERGADPAASVEWLRQRGITHVVFAWSEIDRLRSTYGFSPAVTHAWVAQLVAVGLQPVKPPPGVGRIQWEVLAVPAGSPLRTQGP